jgi:hypothetical protein
MHDSLTPYVDVLRAGERTDAQIARMAKVSADDVVAARAELAATPAPAVDPGPPAGSPDVPPPGGESPAVSEPAPSPEPEETPEEVAERAEYRRRGHIEICASAIAFIKEADLRPGDEGDHIPELRAVLKALGVTVEEAAPRAVRITRAGTTRVLIPGRAPMVVGFRGVYTGDDAAALWRYARAIVEPYAPPAPKA